MAYIELDLTVEMPAVGNAYHISVHVSGYEPTFGDEENTKSFKLQVIQWQTYCDELNDDVHHTMYDQWMCGHDMLDMLGQVTTLIAKMS